MRLTGENRSPLPRYYYSPFDHEINPVWTRDGKSIVYVSNRGRIHGTGGFWQMAAVPGAVPQELHYEETNWRARPDFSPDGGRIVYSSYLGRNWLQLWLMPGDGGEPFPADLRRLGREQCRAGHPMARTSRSSPTPAATRTCGCWTSRAVPRARCW